MADSLRVLNAISFLIAVFLSIVFVVCGLVSYKKMRKRRSKAIFIIPMRRFYFFLSVFILFGSICAYTILYVFIMHRIALVDFLCASFQLLFSFGLMLWFDSSDILILDEGIYSFLTLTRWDKITRIYEDSLAVYIYKKARLFKRTAYAKFIWKIGAADFRKLHSLFVEKTTPSRR